MAFVVVDPGDDRRARNKAYVWESLISSLKIREGTPIVHAHPHFVLLRVGQFVVMHHCVHMWQDLGHELPWDVTGSLDRGVDSAVMRLLQQRRTKVRLQQALAAAQRDAAAAASSSGHRPWPRCTC
jgi:hypothetical protein